jgi:hypothetical protein
MFSIPLINVVALCHFFFISAFLGLYAAEVIIESYPYYFKKNDERALESTIYLHYWIDNLVELPVFLGIIITGIWMTFLIDKITPLHVIKIVCVVLAVSIGFIFCFLNVNKRYRLFKKGQISKKQLNRKAKTIFYSVLFPFNLFFFAALFIGVWLAYHRVLDLIYGIY